MFNTTLCYIEKDGAYLMIHRIKKQNDMNKDKWIGVGGKFEEAETPFDCARREIKEETSLDVETESFCEADQKDYMHKRTVQLIMYLNVIHGEVRISEEHTDWMWASLDKLKTLEITSSLKKVLEKRNWNV